jgi:hypothetical protein
MYIVARESVRGRVFSAREFGALPAHAGERIMRTIEGQLVP